MAGDWIKVRSSLWSHPKVVTVAKRLGVTRAYAIGALCCAWFVTDQHADDEGVLQMTSEALDSLTETPGLADAMVSVGWLVVHDDCIQVPRYQEHNGSTAKSRAVTQKRVKKHRSGNAGVTPERYQRREEKKREEKKETTPSISQGRVDRFDDFWSVFPRREARGQAERAWKAALKLVDAETIIDGARRYAASRAGQDPQYTKMGATWLNGKCWDDQPPTEQPWTERPDAQWLKEV